MVEAFVTVGVAVRESIEHRVRMLSGGSKASSYSICLGEVASFTGMGGLSTKAVGSQLE